MTDFDNIECKKCEQVAPFENKLQTLYKESVRVQNSKEISSIKPIIEEFNKTLEKIKITFPDKSDLQFIKSLPPTGHLNTYNTADLTRMKMSVIDVMNDIGIVYEDLETPITSENKDSIQQTIVIHNIQSVETVIYNVNNLPITQEEKDILKSYVKDFDDETKKEQPNKTILKKIWDEVIKLDHASSIFLFSVIMQQGWYHLVF